MIFAALLLFGLIPGTAPGALAVAMQANGSSVSGAEATPKSDTAQPDASSSSTAKTAPVIQHKKRRHKTTPGRTEKVVVKNGSTPDPGVQFSTTGSKAEATHQRENTDGLVTSTDANLRKISGRTLSPKQEDMRTEIESYLRQAKVAQDMGDTQSAYNLALKANLLSKELAGEK